MNLTVDASVFVAASRVDEIHYPVSRRFLREVTEQHHSIFCPTLVLPECAAAVARPTADPTLAGKLVHLIEDLPLLQLIPIDHTLARQAAEIAKINRLRGADSVYVSVAELTDSQLVTWDMEMLERGSATVTTLTPKDWLEGQVIIEG
jgi:predicted nucleic acid-binding protein